MTIVSQSLFGCLLSVKVDRLPEHLRGNIWGSSSSEKVQRVRGGRGVAVLGSENSSFSIDLCATQLKTLIACAGPNRISYFRATFAPHSEKFGHWLFFS
jgi:hypothetical protein